MNVEHKLDRIEERLDSIDKTLAVNTELLAVHIRRTNLLEETLEPIKVHVSKVDLIGQIFMWVVGLGSVASVIFRFFFPS